MKIFLLLTTITTCYSLNTAMQEQEKIIHRTEQVILMTCIEPWFSLIKQGTKSIVGRKNCPEYQKMQVGDHIEFINVETQARLQVRVTEIRRYSSIENYLQDVGIDKAVPVAQSFEEALKIYHQFDTPQEIARDGFLGIFITIQDNRLF